MSFLSLELQVSYNMDTILRSVQCTTKRQVGPSNSLDMKTLTLSLFLCYYTNTFLLC